MPNHIHLLIRITERINPFPTKRYDIPNVIGKYKAAVTRRVGNAFMHSVKLRQTSFHDHIIRDEADYRRIWTYIDTNPANGSRIASIWRNNRINNKPASRQGGWLVVALFT